MKHKKSNIKICKDRYQRIKVVPSQLRSILRPNNNQKRIQSSCDRCLVKGNTNKPKDCISYTKEKLIYSTLRIDSCFIVLPYMKILVSRISSSNHHLSTLVIFLQRRSNTRNTDSHSVHQLADSCFNSETETCKIQLMWFQIRHIWNFYSIKTSLLAKTSDSNQTANQTKTTWKWTSKVRRNIHTSQVIQVLWVKQWHQEEIKEITFSASLFHCQNWKLFQLQRSTKWKKCARSKAKIQPTQNQTTGCLITWANCTVWRMIIRYIDIEVWNIIICR